MESNNIIKYSSRTFGEIRADLVSFIRQAYPEVLSDFTDSSVGAMLIDLNAGVANNLAISTDRLFQETQLEYAQLRTSILDIAQRMGFNIPAKRPSVTVIDFTATIPTKGDRPNEAYYPILAPGAQVLGGGKIFETQETIDWNSPISNLGDANRSIIPNYDSNGVITSFDVTKREVVVNGSTNIFKRVINTSDVIPFFTVTLPDPDVIEIENVILLEGTNFSSPPSISEFFTSNNRFFEVDYLAQPRVFVENMSLPSSNNDGIMAANWIDVTKKFIKEYTANGYCKLTFGSGDSDVDAFKSGMIKSGVNNRAFLDNFLNNTALGEKLKAGYTLFVRYRTGGGSNSNLGSNVLTQLGQIEMNISGSREDFKQSVRRSLKVTNPIPAIGGNDGLSVEQIRQLIKYNYSSQNRDVSLTDYLIQIYKMPGKFGSPYRANAFKENNKIIISTLGIGSDGKLSSASNSLLMRNITEYLTEFRTVNDFVEVKPGQIINLSLDIEVYVENVTDNLIANNIISIVNEYFSINNHEMNEDIFMGKLYKKILEANGVVNIISVKVFNKVGGNYSNNTTSQKISNTTTGEVQIVNNTIYSKPDSMFEIKFPEKDIRVILRKKTNNEWNT